MLAIRSALRWSLLYQHVRPSSAVLRPSLKAQCPWSFFPRELHSAPATYISRMDSQVDELITFYTDRNPQEWYFPPEGFDTTLRDKYSDLVAKARAHELDSLADTPKGALALIILLDQIPRNIFRQSDQSFSSDAKALDITTKAIAQKFDQEIGKQSKIQQYLFYMPLMHAEDLLAQVTAMSLVENLIHGCSENDKAAKEFAVEGLPVVQRHLDCVLKLGRFPKRNDPLGRKTTPEEEKFLEENPAGF